MNVYKYGTPVNLVERFYLIDPLTEDATLTNPTGVTFELEGPDGTETSYVWPGAPEVTNPEPGVFVCALPLSVLTLVGDYRTETTGTGAVQASSPDAFEVAAPGVDPMPAGGPTLGPCQSWIGGEDVVASGCSIDTGSTGPALLDPWAIMASMVMFELSGRQFPGVCERRVRPCRDACGCWPGGDDGAWTWASLAADAWAWAREGCADRCGCGSESHVRLAGYPVRQIVEVKIDGAVVDPSEYELVQRRKLLRLADPGPPVRGRRWPTCQNLALADDQPGTFSIRYRWGVDPPPLGREAAAQLACELAKAGTGGKDCKLPSKATKIVRQGVTIERVTPIAQLLRQGSSGLPLVDAFIAAYNPSGLRRRTAVWSPDMPAFPREG